MLAHSNFSILPQPDDASCGPTCLHAVYNFHGDMIPLRQVIDEVEMNPTGGTLACQLGRHALRRGYRASTFTYNLNLFDPTWFAPGVDLSAKLREQMAAKPDPRLALATNGYLDYLTLGGRVLFEDLNEKLLVGFLSQNLPVMAGLSATYLYQSAREVGEEETAYDDVRGLPCGHFVVLCDFDPESREVLVADPYENNPLHGDHLYKVPVDRLLSSILLGIVTYDATLLVISPGSR